MFPGQGGQYVRMGAALYENAPVFRDKFDECTKIVNQLSGLNLLDFVVSENSALLKDQISETYLAQPLLFSFEYSLAH